MTDRRRALFTGAAILLVLIAAGAAGFFRLFARRPVAPLAEAVPSSWVQFRTSAGHARHVENASIACRECHDIGVAGFTGANAGVCGRCHETELARTHRGGAKGTDCLVCHNFAPQGAVSCVDCHREKQEAREAVVQHASVDCKKCHNPHREPAIQPADCESCHDERAGVHAAHSGSKNCLDCHRAHEPGRAALATCSTCHQRVATTALAAHDTCTTCHRPHEFAAGPQICSACHGEKPTLLASSVDAHGRCTSCHAPHAPERADRACERCHKEVEVSHAGEKACTTCHRPHGGDTHAKSSACTTCHASVAASDRGAHAGDQPCTACHEPHAFPAPPRAELCAKCHAGEVRLASTMAHARVDGPGKAGHAACASCHGAAAHRPERPPACDSCHASEGKTAPLGHRKCEGCHDPHSGGEIVAGCTTCHANKGQALHAAVRGGCENCHRAHGPSGVAVAPPCASCHARSSLPALHAVPQHGDCAQCHGAHAPPRADRKTCTAGCHADRKGHQPSAVLCTGCHVFRD